MQKILITGAAGFIGYHLYNKLKKDGLDVVGLDNYDHPCGGVISDCIKGDIRDRHLVDELVKNSDTVYHLAAQIHVDRSYEDTQLTFDVNVHGTENILKSCTKYKVPVVFPSSVEVYGTAQGDRISESHPINPQNPYAESKYEAEKLCVYYRERHGTSVSILRNFNTYGPYQNNSKYGSVIPIFVKRIIENEPPLITGDGTQTRDFMYIDDALNGYEIMSRYNGAEPVNFGTGIDISINDLSELLLSILDSNVKPIHVKPRPNEIMKIKGDISKARTLGFSPKVTLEDGLRKYIEWFKSHKP